jgi:hypothetical protein
MRRSKFEFTQTTADRICEELANGASLRAICTANDLPSAGTVCRWLAENELFAEQYARAREAQAEFYADEIVSISDGDGDDEAPADPTRDRLRVDARKWVASKLLPKKYGDRQELNVSGSIDVRAFLLRLGEPED